MQSRQAAKGLKIFITTLAGLTGLLLLVSCAFSEDVLLLNSYHDGMIWTDEVTKAVQKGLSEKIPSASVHVEYMDSKRHFGKSYSAALKTFYLEKYKRTDFDLIVTTDDNALNFALKSRPILFPGTPIIFCGVNHYEKKRFESLTGVSGIIESYDLEGTIKLALRLHPETRNVFVVNDRTPTGIANRKVIDRVVENMENDVSFKFSGTPSMEELQTRLASLPDRTVVLLCSFNRDGTGTAYTYRQSIDSVSSACRAPVYGFWGFYLGRGIVGGSLTFGRIHGEKAADLAADVLKGKDPDDIEIITQGKGQYAFDFNMIEHFKIDGSQLPEDSILINKPAPSFIQKHMALVIFLLVSMSVMLVSILFLFAAFASKRKSEYKYRLLADNSNDIIWTRDLDLNVTYLTPSIEKILGYTPEEAMNLPNEEKMPEESHDRMVKLFLEEIENENLGHLPPGRSRTVEIQMYRKDGTVADLETTVGFLRNKKGTPLGILGISRDISQRKAAEEELKIAGNYINNIIDSMPSILMGVDSSGYITHWNRLAEEKTGISRDAARQSHLQSVYPEIADEMETIRTAIREQKVISIRKDRLTRDKKHCHEDVVIYPLTGSEEKGAVIRVDDVTERVRMTDLMIQSEKMLSVGGLAAGMAHEINNPLAGMIQNAQVVINRLTLNLPANEAAAAEAGTDMETLRRFMEKRSIPGFLSNITASGMRAAKIVNNMLSFSKKGDSIKEQADIRDVLDTSIELAENDYNIKKNHDFRRIQIKREYQNDLPEIPCEPSKLQQVFLNIFKNGAEAMMTRSMESGADDSEPPCFHVKCVSTSREVRIEIRDNGPGIPENVRKRIFEPFFTTKGPEKGTGLGLSVAYFIITRNHGGRMSVESAEGSGTKFIITLPADKKPA
ncbi:MAG: PAS domain S-box protein [Desulfobacteraceae bacterium]